MLHYNKNTNMCAILMTFKGLSTTFKASTNVSYNTNFTTHTHLASDDACTKVADKTITKPLLHLISGEANDSSHNSEVKMSTQSLILITCTSRHTHRLCSQNYRSLEKLTSLLKSRKLVNQIRFSFVW